MVGSKAWLMGEPWYVMSDIWEMVCRVNDLTKAPLQSRGTLRSQVGERSTRLLPGKTNGMYR